MAEADMERSETVKRTWWLTFRESLGFASLLLWPSRNRSRAVYELLSSHNSLAEKSMYINLGYWEDASTFDDACAALARRLGQVAGLSADDEVLDCGCGFGDQDRLFVEEFGPRKITALNITPSQVDVARQRVTDARVSFVVGSATDMPFEADQFDVVLGLESPFHFDPRADFFVEAARVLRPGGRLAVADVVPRKAPSGVLAWMQTWVGAALWQVPLSNFHDLDTYMEHLKAAGFVDIQVEDISEHVFRPFKKYAVGRTRDPEVVARVHPLLRSIWGTDHGQLDSSAYLLITATVPSC